MFTVINSIPYMYQYVDNVVFSVIATAFAVYHVEKELD